MTERRDLAAAPTPWTGGGGPVPAAPSGTASGAGRGISAPFPPPGGPRPAAQSPGAADAADEPYARVDARKLEAALLGLRKPL